MSHKQPGDAVWAAYIQSELLWLPLHPLSDIPLSVSFWFRDSCEQLHMGRVTAGHYKNFMENVLKGNIISVQKMLKSLYTMNLQNAHGGASSAVA